MRDHEGDAVSWVRFEDLVRITVEAFGRIPDFRAARGRQYRLAGLLGLVVVGLASGCNSLAEIARFGSRRRDLRKELGLRRAPSHATLWRAVTRVDPEALRRVLGRVGGELLVARCEQVVAFDAKTMRASRTPDGRLAQMVAACEHRTGAVLDSAEVRRGQSELTVGRKAVRSLLEKHPEVAVVTGDALYADRVLAAQITRSGRDYVFKLKKINLSSSRR